jgi:hypothetical protein
LAYRATPENGFPVIVAVLLAPVPDTDVVLTLEVDVILVELFVEVVVAEIEVVLVVFVVETTVEVDLEELDVELVFGVVEVEVLLVEVVVVDPSPVVVFGRH